MPVSFYNSSGEAIPAYAVMQINGATSSGGRKISTVIKPDLDLNTAGYLLNGPTYVPPNSTGTAFTADEPAWALYASGPPVSGDEWGPVSNEWDISEDGDGFRIVGAETAGRVLVRSVFSGGGLQLVRFVITTVDCEACTAEAIVISRPPGVAITQGDSSNPYSPYGLVIDIVDLAGCFLNAPNADLIGRIGYAARLSHGGYGEDNNFGDRCGIGEGTYWEIISLCCSSDQSCGEA